jgi:small subunit ribosomal protein S4
MRYTGSSCRQCRREGTKLFLKGTKCFTEKCPVERRPYAPGQHGQATARRRKASEYAKQLREKQKIKRIYGVSEKQFRNTFENVSTQPGITGHNLLAALESRLDNMVYRLGFASSRKAARQLVRHRHIEVNGRTVDIPSFLVLPGQEIRVRTASRENAYVQQAMEHASRGASPSWLAVDRDTFSGRMLERPTRPNIPIAAQEQLVIELYSK